MKFNRIYLCFFIFVSSIFSISAEEAQQPQTNGAQKLPVSKKEMKYFIRTLESVFDNLYAPRSWKEELFGFDLRQVTKNAVKKINSNPAPTIRDCQKVLLDYVKETHDFHVGLELYSTEYSFLPFQVRSVDDRFFITAVFQEYFQQGGAPFQEGDELLTFNGEDVATVCNRLKTEDPTGYNAGTYRGLADQTVTLRESRSGHDTPEGDVSLVFLPRGSATAMQVTLPWIHGEEIYPDPNAKATPKILVDDGEPDPLISPTTHPDLFPVMKMSDMYMPKTKGANRQTVAKESFVPQRRQVIWEEPEEIYSNPNTGIEYKNFADNGEPAPLISPTTHSDLFPVMKKGDTYVPKTRGANWQIGAKESFVPQLGQIIWEGPEESDFDSYIYINEQGKRIGYLRIPSYMFDSIQELRQAFNLFEKYTDGLVIDQTNNGGGLVAFCYALASLIITEPAEPPKHRISINNDTIEQSLELIDLLSKYSPQQVFGDNIGGYPVTPELAQNFLEHSYYLLDQWTRGKEVTEPCFISGVISISPDQRIHYTKPVLMLINELDFSCADFLPSLLQDAGRVVLLGSKTSGAGGYVSNTSITNRLGVKSIRYTGSVAERPRGLGKLENLGVTPDIGYELTPYDYQSGYAGYRSVIQSTIDQMVR